MRKAIHIMLLVTGVTGSGFGQNPALRCFAESSLPPTVRSEGITELVGDVVLQCLGGVSTPAGSPVPTIDITLTLNTNITSRQLTGGNSDALLLIDEPAQEKQLLCTPGPCPILGTGDGAGVYNGTGSRPNVFQGRVGGVPSGNSNTLIWLSVPIDPPGSNTTRIVRISNARANANALANPIGGSLITGTLNCPVCPNTQFNLGVVGQDSLFQVVNPLTLLRGSAADPSQAANQFQLRFTEPTPNGFKTKSEVGDPYSADNPRFLGGDAIPGSYYYNGESGWGNERFGTSLGVADSGTRLRTFITGIPANVDVYASLYETGKNASTSRVRLVQTDANGAGAFAPVPSSPNVPGFALLPRTGLFTSAVWEVTKSDPAVVEQLFVSMAANSPANSPSLGTAFVTGGYAPISSVATASEAPIPRFTPRGGFVNPVPAFAISSSLTGAATLSTGLDQFTVNLDAGTYYPYVTYLSVYSNTAPLTPAVSTTTNNPPTSWFQAELLNTKTPATIRIIADPTGLAPGAYTGTITVTAPGVTTTARTTVRMNLADVVRPKVNAVTNAASNLSGPLSPGQVAVAYGERMGSAGLAGLRIDNNSVFTTIAGESQMIVDGQRASMVYGSPAQVAFIAPYGIAGKSSVQVQSEYQGHRSDPVTVPVAPVKLALFTANGSGTGPAAALNEDYSTNLAANAVERTHYIQLFGTGEGLLTPRGVDGKVSGVPVSMPAQPVSVRFGGVTVPAAYAGTSPGLVYGILQVNAQVPDSVGPGPVPVTLVMGGQESQAGVTVFVK